MRSWYCQCRGERRTKRTFVWACDRICSVENRAIGKIIAARFWNMCSTLVQRSSVVHKTFREATEEIRVLTVFRLSLYVNTIVPRQNQHRWTGVAFYNKTWMKHFGMATRAQQSKRGHLLVAYSCAPSEHIRELAHITIAPESQSHCSGNVIYSKPCDDDAVARNERNGEHSAHGCACSFIEFMMHNVTAGFLSALSQLNVAQWFQSISNRETSEVRCWMEKAFVGGVCVLCRTPCASRTQSRTQSRTHVEQPKAIRTQRWHVYGRLKSVRIAVWNVHRRHMMTTRMMMVRVDFACIHGVACDFWVVHCICWARVG